MSESNRLSRRAFLKVAGISMGGLALSACQPRIAEEAPEGEAPQAEAPAAELEKVVIWSPGDSGSVTDWDADPLLQEVERVTSTDINNHKMDWGTYVDQVNAAVASGEVPDIIGCISQYSCTMIDQWVRGGVVAAFEGDIAAAAPNVLEEYEITPYLKELKIDGKIYMQPVSWGNKYYPGGGIIHVRRDLLDKYGMEPPDTFEQYFEFLRATTDGDGEGLIFGAQERLEGTQGAFCGAYGLPAGGWVKKDDQFEFWAIQPHVKDGLLLLRKMVEEGLVDPESWSTPRVDARDKYAAGQGASLIYGGGGHTGRIQLDMELAGQGHKNWLLPAPDAGQGSRGYTATPQFANVSFLGNLEDNHPVAAARVINFLISEEGYELTAIGIEGHDWHRENGEIVLDLEQQKKDGFPVEGGDVGGHPLATAIASWMPQEWQDWMLCYGKPQEWKDWYYAMWDNQGKYSVQPYGVLSTSPLWNKFQAVSTELADRAHLPIVQAGSEEEASEIFDQFVQDWLSQGGADAQAEMSDLLAEIYG